MAEFLNASVKLVFCVVVHYAVFRVPVAGVGPRPVSVKEFAVFCLFEVLPTSGREERTTCGIDVVGIVDDLFPMMSQVLQQNTKKLLKT